MTTLPTTHWTTQKQKPTTPWYATIINAIQTRVDASLAAGLEVPVAPGGWIHNFICQEDWSPLRYDRTRPESYVSLQGKTYSGDPFTGGWLAWRHRDLADTARDAALLYDVTGETRYLDAAKTVLLAYAERYPHFAGDEDAEAWMTKGRAFNQALSEALWAAPLIQAFTLLQATLSDEEKNVLVTSLFMPIMTTLSNAHDSLIRQGKVHSNYVAWLIAAIGSFGFAIHDEALIARSIDGEGGFKAHVDASILADGFQYEVTPYYHNFVALAFIYLAEAALPHGVDLYAYRGENGQSIERLWEAFAKLAYPDGSIPELNDGSYWPESIYDSEICDVYEVAQVRASSMQDTYAWLTRKAYERRNSPRDRWTALVFAQNDLTNTPVALESVCLEDAGVVVLKDGNALAACVPYGKFAGSHSHYDRLALNIWPFSQDAGTPLYGVKERITWYQQTLAHNTIVVDGASQHAAAGTLKTYMQNSVSLQANTLYDGVRMQRILSLRNNNLHDTFDINAEQNHRYDWLCHSDEPWDVTNLTTHDLQETYGNDDAGRLITILKKTPATTQLNARTSYQGKHYQLELVASAPFEVLLAVCPGRSQQPHVKRQVLIARVFGASVRFDATYRVIA